MAERLSTTTEGIYQKMLVSIQRGEWPVGTPIPSERTLIETFGVSRIAVREAVSMLRGLGVLDVHHGKRTRVRGVGVDTLDQLLPLMLADGSDRTFDQVFELRLALESQGAFLAAKGRSEAQLREMRRLSNRYAKLQAINPAQAIATDLKFHLAVADASGNPLFHSLLSATSRFVGFAQAQSCHRDPERLERAAQAHESIVEAIAASDPELARAEMEAHLRYSASRRMEVQKLAEKTSQADR